jgi:hypothetical protein
MIDTSPVVEFWFRDGREKEGWLMVGQHVPRPCDGRIDASGAGVATHRHNWMLSNHNFLSLSVGGQANAGHACHLMKIFCFCNPPHAFHSAVRCPMPSLSMHTAYWSSTAMPSANVSHACD